MGTVERYLASLEKYGIRLGLERIRFILEKLGNPQDSLKTIHVAGTNGKGSTCAMIAALLKEAGYKVGLFTSPHLFSFRERFQINGQEISQAELSKGIRLISQIVKQGLPEMENPTVFEALTALAFWYFGLKKVDYAVIEVGLGGRLDATNVITPLVSVITNIDLEHIAVLGDTLGQIAYEKSGIIKENVPVVTAERKPAALRVIRQIAKRRNSEVTVINKLQAAKLGKKYELNLIGNFQYFNAACAIAALKKAGLTLGPKMIQAGLSQIKWPARMQLLSRRPLTVLDGAHNPAGAGVLRATLEEEYPGKKFVFVLGMQKDKDAGSTLKELRPIAEKFIFTFSTNKDAAEMIDNREVVPLAKALKETAGNDRVIAGSLFLVADALRYFKKRV